MGNDLSCLLTPLRGLVVLITLHYRHAPLFSHEFPQLHSIVFYIFLFLCGLPQTLDSLQCSVSTLLCNQLACCTVASPFLGKAVYLFQIYTYVTHFYLSQSFIFTGSQLVGKILSKKKICIYSLHKINNYNSYTII